MSRKLSLFGLALTALVFAGCGSDAGTNPGGAMFSVDFKSSAGHIHIWETSVTYTANVTTGAANLVVSDFDSLFIEYATVGSNTWTRLGTKLALGTGGAYAVTTYWPQAGNFNIRLRGSRFGLTSGIETIYAPATPVAPVRQHFDIAGTTWRVEFEPNPGVNKPGDTVTMNFYVMEATADVSGNRAPITGLTGLSVTCTTPTGATVDRTPVESGTTPGLYQTTCTVPTNGWAHAALKFMNTSGQPSATGNYGVGAVS